MAPVFPRLLLQFAETQGIVAEELCQVVGLAAAELRNDEARVELVIYYQLLELLALRLEDPHFGLRMAGPRPLRDHGIVGFLALNSANVAQALERAVRYQSLHGVEPVAMTRHDGVVSFAYRPWGPNRPAHLHAGDVFVAETVFGVSMVCGDRVRPTRIQLRRRRPRTVDLYRQLLGAEPQFDAEHDAVTFAEEILEWPVRGADPALGALLEARAQQMRANVAWPRPDDSWCARVREIVASAMQDGAPSLADVALRLDVSSRTLQRRLSEEQATLSRLVDEVREELAQRYLRCDHSSSEVALLLGYSELSAFDHAFRRWTGQSPAEFRRQLA